MPRNTARFSLNHFLQTTVGYILLPILFLWIAGGVVYAADVSLSVQPDNAPTGGGQRTVQMTVPTGYNVTDHLIWLSASPSLTPLTNVSFANAPASSLSGAAGVQDTWNTVAGNVIFSRTFNPATDTVTGPVPPVELGTVVFTGANDPLFMLVSPNSWVLALNTSTNTVEQLGIVGLPTVTTPAAGGGTTAPPAGPVIAECDLCGYCVADESGSIPGDYARCTQCLYGSSIVATPDRVVPSPMPGNQWTVFGCMQSDVAGYTNQVMSIATAVIGGIAFLVMLYGGFLILTSSGDSGKLSTGKRLVATGIVAAILVFSAVLIFRTVGADLLKIPGIQ